MGYTAAAMLPKQAGGTFRKHIKKPSEQVAAPPSIYDRATKSIISFIVEVPDLNSDIFSLPKKQHKVELRFKFNDF